jgi:cytochrome c-type protein NapC
MRRLFALITSHKKMVAGSLAIFALGFLSFGGVNAFFDYTNQTEFCVSCHSLQWVNAEYEESMHFKNRSGVQAGCADCHVPKAFLPKLKAKILAYNDVWHEIRGTVNTEEKFNEHRWRLANRVWDRMKANDSRECRSCHEIANMDFSAQDRNAKRRHERAEEEGYTCIDCHKGVAHIMPDEPEESDTDEPVASSGHIIAN